MAATPNQDVPSMFALCQLVTGFNCPEQIIDYVQTPTDAAIASSTLGLFAVVVAYLAYYKLRNKNMDLDINRVNNPSI